MTVYGDRAFREGIRFNEVGRVGPSPYRAGALISRGRQGLPSLGTKTQPSEDTVRQWPSSSQERSPHQKPTCRHLDLRLPASRSVRK